MPREKLASIVPSQKRRFDIGQGSITFETVRVKDDQLTFQYTPEVVGGYTVYECTVLVSPTPVTIKINADETPGETSFDLSKCKVIQSGNVLLDGQTNETSDRKALDPFFAHLEFIERQAENPGVARAVFDADPQNKKIVRFVEFLASKRIHIQYDEPTKRWRVATPSFGDYVVQVENIGAFPDDSTLLEMQLGCRAINLAHGLNPKAKLIMSLPGLTRVAVEPTATLSTQEWAKQTAEIRSSTEYIALESKLKQLFIAYEP